MAGRSLVATHATEWALAGLATGLVLLGWGVARWRWGRYRDDGETRLGRFLLSGWGADAAVDRLVVEPFAAIAGICSIGFDRALVDASIDGLAPGRRPAASACGG